MVPCCPNNETLLPCSRNYNSFLTVVVVLYHFLSLSVTVKGIKVDFNFSEFDFNFSEETLKLNDFLYDK